MLTSIYSGERWYKIFIRVIQINPSLINLRYNTPQIASLNYYAASIIHSISRNHRDF